MFKKLMFAAAVVLATAPTAASQQPTAADFARNMQGAIGQTFEGGITIKDITHEEATLVMVVDGPAGWRTGLTPDMVSQALVGGFCTSAPQFFATGVTMRVDSFDSEVLVQGPVVSECPAAAEPQSEN